MVSAHVTTRALGGRDFASPVDDRWFEDYRPGETFEYGWRSVTDEEIVEYAVRYDPQRLHTDPAWAETGPYGGLIASGWQSAGLMMRLYCDHYISAVASLGSPGVDELRWSSPLRPNDPVRLRVSVAQARPSRSRPDRGIVRTEVALLTEDDRCPLSLMAMNLVLRRPAA
ncbi:MAG: hypothetical protein QOE59_1238 [Actinomycetota bacterium]|jgi:acyl dehydratase|nr:hypothetical protein [Actinomycetota bacterium]